MAAFVLLITLCSAVPTSNSNPTPLVPSAVEAASQKFNTYAADGKFTNKELMDVATTLKGEKLTLKEKIALKLFGKKIVSKSMKANAGGDGKSQLIALLLAFFVGGLGIHRFYLGYTWQGVVQLLTLGGCGIWSLIDFIRIITGDLTPKDGAYGKTL